jgi:hypothetical protein
MKVDPHLTAAILDRITENCTVFNMSRCISIRHKKVVYATDKAGAEGVRLSALLGYLWLGPLCAVRHRVTEAH